MDSKECDLQRISGKKYVKRLLGWLALLCSTAGCSIQTSFPDRSSQQVWTAMKAVALNPDYEVAHYTKRWTVVSNLVDVDEDTYTIEIDRSLERILQRPRTNPLYETAAWVFTVQLIPGDPPRTEIQNRSISLPTKFQFEAERFFSDMRVLLAAPAARRPGATADRIQ